MLINPVIGCAARKQLCMAMEKIFRHLKYLFGVNFPAFELFAQALILNLLATVIYAAGLGFFLQPVRYSPISRAFGFCDRVSLSCRRF